MGLLGDLYSTIDSKKRQLRGLLSDPLETLYQGVRNFGAEQQGLLDMQARAYPWTGTDRTAAPDLAARKALADAGAAQGMAAATVWHGSPHKFDKFDSSKIGTGEGAQAYGHGLYLAESPDVARTYTTSTNHVAKQDWVQLDGVPYRATQTRAEDTAHNVAADALSRFDYDKKAAMGWLENYGRDLEAKKIIKSTKKFGPTNDPATSMYKVDLPDEHIAKMLDWDKPLSQQHPDVQSVLLKHPDVLDQIQKAEAQRVLLNERSPMRLDKIPSASIPYDASRMVGKDALTAIQQRSGLGVTGGVEQQLRQAGIPGIRYLDGGSRSAGQGSSNFVVFPGNEGLLSILERNGAPIK